MKEILKTVELGGKQFPIKCDIDVLILIQEQFENINNFETQILGMKPKKDKKGNIIKKITADGTEAIDYEMGLPSIRAIRDVLPLMIYEGLEQASEQGTKAPMDDYEALIKEVDFNIIDTALAIYEEFQRCFLRKKSTTPKNTTSKKASPKN